MALKLDVALILPVVLLLVDCKLDSGVNLLTDCPDGKAVGVDDELLNRLFNVSRNEGRAHEFFYFLFVHLLCTIHVLSFYTSISGKENNQKPQTDNFYMLSFSKIINREARMPQNGQAVLQAVLQVITSNIC